MLQDYIRDASMRSGRALRGKVVVKGVPHIFLPDLCLNCIADPFLVMTLEGFEPYRHTQLVSRISNPPTLFPLSFIVSFYVLLLYISLMQTAFAFGFMVLILA